MVNENGENWKNLRKHLSPPLTNRKTAQHYASDMNEIADELIDILSTNKRRLEHDTEGESCFFQFILFFELDLLHWEALEGTFFNYFDIIDYQPTD